MYKSVLVNSILSSNFFPEVSWNRFLNHLVKTINIINNDRKGKGLKT